MEVEQVEHLLRVRVRVWVRVRIRASVRVRVRTRARVRVRVRAEQVEHPHGRRAEHRDALRVVDPARVAAEQDLELRGGGQPVKD